MVFRNLHYPVLGTNLMVIIASGHVEPDGPDDIDDALAERIDAAIATEMTRLEAIFTIFDEGSELQRWKRGDLSEPSVEFCEVMAKALVWWERSGGTFEPRISQVTDVWRRAAIDGSTPDPRELAEIVAHFDEPGYEIIDGVPVVTGDVSGFQLHAFAKGWIVDRALLAGLGVLGDGGVEDGHRDGIGLAGTDVNLIVNAGGDIAHRGPNPQPIGIEHPLRTFDNEPPVARVRLRDAGLATSGRARQGFEIDGQWFSHVIDPRTGWPVDVHASVSVVAPSAADADVIATIAGVEPTSTALEVANRHDVGCLVIDNDGEQHHNDGWAAHLVR